MADEPNRIQERGQQLFPVFSDAQLHRLHRFGIVRRHLSGTNVVARSESTGTLFFVLSGSIAVTLRGPSGEATQITTYGPGALIGEFAVSSGCFPRVTARALDPLAVLLVSGDGLHALLVGEPKLGERILSALMLRCADLKPSAANCPVIVGSRSSKEVLRLEASCERHQCPLQTLDPGIDGTAQALIEEFKVEPSELPLVLCPNGRLLRNPTVPSFELAMGFVKPTDPDGH